jgi:hypothetical protein
MRVGALKTRLALEPIMPFLFFLPMILYAGMYDVVMGRIKSHEAELAEDSGAAAVKVARTANRRTR